LDNPEGSHGGTPGEASALDAEYPGMVPSNVLLRDAGRCVLLLQCSAQRRRQSWSHRS